MYKFCKVITLIWPSHGTCSINSDQLTKTLNLTESQSISIWTLFGSVSASKSVVGPGVFPFVPSNQVCEVRSGNNFYLSINIIMRLAPKTLTRWTLIYLNLSKNEKCTNWNHYSRDSGAQHCTYRYVDKKCNDNRSKQMYIYSTEGNEGCIQL